ncbi:hypothetical protein [Dipodfec virus RodF1_35]|uniref:Uncharacterized protein n=1 Tax=Dipodfec virus RodF1_35 TaxID=2929295 RepID=A0A976R5K8_9VIRU|nr:hypothetical protein [Dipodfec virus RodF1_35]
MSCSKIPYTVDFVASIDSDFPSSDNEIFKVTVSRDVKASELSEIVSLLGRDFNVSTATPVSRRIFLVVTTSRTCPNYHIAAHSFNLLTSFNFLLKCLPTTMYRKAKVLLSSIHSLLLPWCR